MIPSQSYAIAVPDVGWCGKIELKEYGIYIVLSEQLLYPTNTTIHPKLWLKMMYMC